MIASSKMKPLIMEDEDAELPSVWRQRFLTALKEITDDDIKDEQVRYIADFLSKQKLTATNASIWKKLKMEKNRKSSEVKLHYKKIEALGVVTFKPVIKQLQNDFPTSVFLT
ncbi:unnamed protein product [Rhizophagus irregularis]|uniref:Uncharacterized protein n=1 Tax=Rhizophagus irregularis TaxID=588596 RepID=A0A916EMJ5_9GLOM|nr:unnamed protein product [Rhizophagus irregularis]CAB5183227.1 unnamed protein product [Rhizophagus irregularis]CAB5395280.1 unnamed protein product [Rhizophagus irregularis]